MLIGPIVALAGKRCFPHVSGIIGGLILVPVSIILCSSQGWIDTEKGFWIVLSITILAAIIVGVLLRKFFWIGIGLVGVASGWTIGFTIYGALLVLTGWNSRWGVWTLQIVCAVAGGVLAFKYGKQIIIVSTSLIGSYLFARGLTLVFDENYPSEIDVIEALSKDEEVTIDWHFWLYFAVWIIGFIGSTHWQFIKEKEDEEKNSDFQKV